MCTEPAPGTPLDEPCEALGDARTFVSVVFRLAALVPITGESDPSEELPSLLPTESDADPDNASDTDEPKCLAHRPMALKSFFRAGIAALIRLSPAPVAAPADCASDTSVAAGPLDAVSVQFGDEEDAIASTTQHTPDQATPYG